MKMKNIFLAILILGVVLNISAVAASDANDTAIANQDDAQEVLQTDDIDESSSDEEPETIMQQTKISTKTVSAKQNSKTNVKATVKTTNDTPVEGVTVTFKINGKIYTAKTDSKGIATAKITVPKTKAYKISAKTKNSIVTKTTEYKKTYTCTASIAEDDQYESSSTNFKVVSTKNKKVEKYRITKKQVKTITVPYKKYGIKEKYSGHYVFGIYHESGKTNVLALAAGDKTLDKTIKFSSKVYYMNHGKKVYIPSNKWLKSKRSNDLHYYYYEGNAKMYATFKYTACTYKKIS